METRHRNGNRHRNIWKQDTEMETDIEIYGNRHRNIWKQDIEMETDIEIYGNKT
jgi:hypothetical protein